MTVSDYVAESLAIRGIECVFELTGGMITHLLDSISRRTAINIVSMHHEQGAAFAAEGAARWSGRPGVAFATSGPGATNLITGIGSCYFDSTPAVFITGQVNRNEQKRDRAIRQLGFQETDIVTMVRPITKAAWRVETADQIVECISDAFALSMAGRRGPVLIDIPMDVQREDVNATPAGDERLEIGQCEPCCQAEMELLFEKLSTRQRPMIVCGGGVRSSSVSEMFRAFAETLGVPVAHSLMAVDVLEYDHPLRVGMLGSYGNRWTNHAVARSDFLLVLGSRLDVRQTGSQTELFGANKIIFHVDCEPGEMNNRITGCYGVHSTLENFLRNALSFVGMRARSNSWARWKDEIEHYRNLWPDTAEIKDVAGINPNALMHRLSICLRDTAVFVVDVGQHQMWAAQSLRLTRGQRFMTSGGMGSMGFALPAAIGTCIASGMRPTAVIAGDGGFQCNIQELQTIVRGNLPVKIVIVNNNCHGMVRQFQESYFGGRYQSTLWGYSAPDFAAIATAYGLPGKTVKTDDELDIALDWLRDSYSGMLQVMIDTFANVYPKIAFGRPMSEMEPMVRPVGVEST